MTTYRVPEDVSGTLNLSNGRIDYAFDAGEHTPDAGSDDAVALEHLAAAGLAEPTGTGPAGRQTRGRKSKAPAEDPAATTDPAGTDQAADSNPDAASGDATTEV